VRLDGKPTPEEVALVPVSGWAACFELTRVYLFFIPRIRACRACRLAPATCTRSVPSNSNSTGPAAVAGKSAPTRRCSPPVPSSAIGCNTQLFSHFLSRFFFACFFCSLIEIPWCCVQQHTGQLRVDHTHTPGTRTQVANQIGSSNVSQPNLNLI
jgi:hypothetical protein